VVDLLKPLDFDYPHLQQQRNWRHLAVEVKAPRDIIEKCNCHPKHSPTIEILERPNIKCKKVQELIDVVKAANRDDVLGLIENTEGEPDYKETAEIKTGREWSL